LFCAEELANVVSDLTAEVSAAICDIIELDDMTVWLLSFLDKVDDSDVEVVAGDVLNVDDMCEWLCTTDTKANPVVDAISMDAVTSGPFTVDDSWENSSMLSV
jgi:hypothetical protein